MNVFNSKGNKIWVKGNSMFLDILKTAFNYFLSYASLYFHEKPVLLQGVGWFAGALNSSSGMFCQGSSCSSPSNNSHQELGSQNAPRITPWRLFMCRSATFLLCRRSDMFIFLLFDL